MLHLMKMHFNKNEFWISAISSRTFSSFYKLFVALEILWDELMSDTSYIGHLLSMVDRLTEVISNGGYMAHQFQTDSVHNYSVRKT